LITSQQSRARRHLFLSERESGRPAQQKQTATAAPINKVGIVGAGTMGSGIAIAHLLTGFEVQYTVLMRDC
jgi:3-hydroxyacyl-CoA dehydrogenase